MSFNVCYQAGHISGNMSREVYKCILYPQQLLFKSLTSLRKSRAGLASEAPSKFLPPTQYSNFHCTDICTLHGGPRKSAST